MNKPILKNEEKHVRDIVREVVQFVKSDAGKKRGIKRDIVDIIKKSIPE